MNATAAASATDSSSSAALYAAINAANSSADTSRKAGASATEGAQDRFLKLLTTQLKNQDPLNPLDNAQMTSQLAQISTVDGITKLNSTLMSLLNNTTDSQTLQAAALVGHSVLVPGNRLTLEDGLAIGGVQMESAADNVVATIKDANGLLIRTLDLGALPAGTTQVSWDGKTDSGATAANGAYTVSFAAKQGANKVTAEALEYGTVTSVAKNTQGVSLTVGRLGTLSLSDVKQII